eukprot:8751956-Alexandrium_andersonii.AAC.1
MNVPSDEDVLIVALESSRAPLKLRTPQKKAGSCFEHVWEGRVGVGHSPKVDKVASVDSK